MKAIVLIGGLGTRLRPLTLTTPKPLLPILNRPFLTYQIDLLKRYGIRELILCTAYRPEAFHRTLGNGRRWGVRLRYVHEKIPLGTGGAIKNAERFVTGTTLIFNGDILMDLNLKDLLSFHKKRSSSATVALTRVQDPTAFGLIETNAKGQIQRFIEKPLPSQVTCNTVNAGVYVFEPEIFRHIPAGIPYSVERQVFPSLLQKKAAMFAKVLPGYWLDIGTLDKYRQAQNDLLKGRIPGYKSLVRQLSKGLSRKSPASYPVIKGPVLIGAGTTFGKGVLIHGPAVLGRRCRIGNHVVIDKCFLMDGVRVGDQTRLKGAVMGAGTAIESGHALDAGAALGDRVIQNGGHSL